MSEAVKPQPIEVQSKTENKPEKSKYSKVDEERSKLIFEDEDDEEDSGLVMAADLNKMPDDTRMSA